MNNLGERLYELRTKHEMSQGDLAEKLDVSRQTISKWENNMSIPELDKIISLSNVFDVTVDYLVKGEGDANANETPYVKEVEYEAVAESLPVKMITKNPTQNLIASLSIGLGAIYLITLLINSVSLITNIINGVAASNLISMFIDMAIGFFASSALLSRKLKLVSVSYILLAIHQIVVLITNFGFYPFTFMIIAAYLLIAVSYFKGNIKNSQFIFILTSTLFILQFGYRCSNYISVFLEYGWGIGNIISSVINTMLSLVPYLIVHIGSAYLMYLKANPKPTYEVPEREFPNRSEMYVSIVKHVLLTLFTFGIYDCIWVYKTTENLNFTDINEKQSGAKKLLLCIFVPFYRIYWFYAQAKRLENMIQHKGKHISDFAVVTLVLAIFVPIVAASAFLQAKINEYAEN